ncbi:MAG: hypothetical protein JW889_00260 [Verrucomicrobia bacterium]|nr:hypothetical protein [Verrucomicrobiota bacterium]
MDTVTFGTVRLSRLILGSNPFSGFSHQSTNADHAMRRYYTTDRIKRTMREAESLGINTILARTDYHIIRLLLEYWDEGGALQWFAQTCPEVGDHAMCVNRAAAARATACHIHGGLMDFLFAQHRLDEIPAIVQMIRDKGMLAGIAAHNPDVIRWAESNLDLDYYMCSYYNPDRRDERAEHVSGVEECFSDDDRRAMTALIPTLSRPAIHYKVMAAGRNDPAAALRHVAATMRPNDAVCIGVFTRDHPDMLKQNAELLQDALVSQSALRRRL